MERLDGDWSDDETNRIYTHSCENMRELDDNSVALTVTSPPYWNAIDYDIHAADKQQHYRTRKYAQGYADYEDYLDWLERIFHEVLRVTKPGGFCAIVIGTVLLNGRHYPVPFDLIARLSRSGWEFHQDIVWHKCTAGVKRAGVTIQKPYPGYYYPNIMTEYILIFRKPGTPIYKQADRSRQRPIGLPDQPVVHDGHRQQRVAHRARAARCDRSSLPVPRRNPRSLDSSSIRMKTTSCSIRLPDQAKRSKLPNNSIGKYVGYETIEKYVQTGAKRASKGNRLFARSNSSCASTRSAKRIESSAAHHSSFIASSQRSTPSSQVPNKFLI